MSKISIIIPVYKVEAFLGACLDSVLAQTYKDWEAICINDGSPDNCPKILEEYAARDSRIKVIHQENKGLSVARNTGLKSATGEYVLFLDSDDVLHPQALEICAHLADENQAEMVSFALERVPANAKIDFPTYQLEKLKIKLTDTPLYFQKKRCKFKVLVNACTKLYRKELIQDLAFIEGITFEDYPHTFAVLKRHPKSVLVNEALYYYTVNPESISHRILAPKNIFDYHTGLKFIYETYKDAPQKERKFVLREIFPNILKQQLNRILKSPKELQPTLWRAFAKELQDLNEKACLVWHGHKLTRYLLYKKLIKKGEE